MEEIQKAVSPTAELRKDGGDGVRLAYGIGTLLSLKRTYACPYDGTFYNRCFRFGYRKATVAMAKYYPQLGQVFFNYLQAIK